MPGERVPGRDGPLVPTRREQQRDDVAVVELDFGRGERVHDPPGGIDEVEPVLHLRNAGGELPDDNLDRLRVEVVVRVEEETISPRLAAKPELNAAPWPALTTFRTGVTR